MEQGSVEKDEQNMDPLKRNMDLVTRTWIHWNGTWIWWTEHWSCWSIRNGTWISNSKKGLSVHHPFSWSIHSPFGRAGHRSFLPTCSTWKFIFESANVLIRGSIPGASHCNLCCIRGSNPDVGQFVMAWSMAYVKLPFHDIGLHNGHLPFHPDNASKRFQLKVVKVHFPSYTVQEPTLFDLMLIFNKQPCYQATE